MPSEDARRCRRLPLDEGSSDSGDDDLFDYGCRWPWRVDPWGLREDFWLARWMFVAFLVPVSIGMVIAFFVMAQTYEGWDFLTTLYVLVQITTTIGYGDIGVKYDSTKMFLIFFVVLSLVVVSFFINRLIQGLTRARSKFFTQRLLQVEAAADRQAGKPPKRQTGPLWTVARLLLKLRRELRWWRRAQGIIDSDEEEAELEQQAEIMLARLGVCWMSDTMILLRTTIYAFGFALVGAVFYTFVEKCTCSYDVTLVPDCNNDSYELCVETGGYTIGFGTAVYMSVITLTTVGFGDHTPKSQVGRVFGIFWMVFGVACTLRWISAASAWLFNTSERRRLGQAFGDDFSSDTFRTIDSNGDGKISRYEFHAYMAIQHGLVDNEVIDILNAQFSSMDPDDTGEVTLEQMRDKSEEIRTVYDL